MLLCLGCAQQPKTAESPTDPSDTLHVDTISILSDIKLGLTKDYAACNYGLNTYQLDSPQMVVVHFTVIPTLDQTIELFSRDSLTTNRTYIKNFSPLNVGIHYVVDRDGSIYNLLPDSIMARHIIGFNHVSLGIENIARDSADLTAEQLLSNARLIHFLKRRHPEITYMIGHDEYNQTELPHYGLFLSLDTTYQPYDKPDPGTDFMRDLRVLLKQQYDLEFHR